MRAKIVIREESASSLPDYARVPIAFDVHERLVTENLDAGSSGSSAIVESIAVPYRKDYDAEPDHHPIAWARRFDVTRWGILAAYSDDVRCGGAVVICDACEIQKRDGRTDLAVLWDLRVAPTHRGRGVGAALFRAAESWARSRGAGWLEVETQDVNTAACRFYASQGCALGAVNRFAYPDLPDETQLLWYKSLTSSSTDRAAPRP